MLPYTRGWHRPEGTYPVNWVRGTYFEPPRLVLCLYMRDALDLNPSLVQPVLPPLEPLVDAKADLFPQETGAVLADEWAQWWNSLIQGFPITMRPGRQVTDIDSLELAAWPTLQGVVQRLFSEGSVWQEKRKSEIEAVRAATDSPITELEQAMLTDHLRQAFSELPQRKRFAFIEMPIQGRRPHLIESSQFPIVHIPNEAVPAPSKVYFVSRQLMLDPDEYGSWLRAEFPPANVG